MKFLKKVKAKVTIEQHPKEVIDVDKDVIKDMKGKLSEKKFLANTDNVDIRDKSIGITIFGYKDRGLNVQIKHNKDRLLAMTANKMSEIIRKALNQALESGELKLPPENA